MPCIKEKAVTGYKWIIVMDGVKLNSMAYIINIFFFFNVGKLKKNLVLHF